MSWENEHWSSPNGCHPDCPACEAEETPMDLSPLLKEPDANITVTRHELLKLCIEADKALDGDSNDAEHDALYSLRESLSEFLEDPERRAED